MYIVTNRDCMTKVSTCVEKRENMIYENNALIHEIHE